jgi:glutamyl-tRNA synthetase
MQVVTRFAPSPTGYLHIGGARTALFNWLFTRRHGGIFRLRVEDTDVARSTEDATRAILDGLNWLGLNWDDEVVYQRARASRHREVAEALVARGEAYYCYTSAEELASQRAAAEAKGEFFRYNREWRDRRASEALTSIAPSIRIKAPLEGEIIVNDLVQGEVRFSADALDDFVILRSDGTPTYMHAVVVDDHDMGVTHVIRGDDHLNNAGRQTILYHAMGWDVPQFAHIPLIHGADGAKLSKRHGALGVEAYRDMGYLPEGVCNYLLRLGWSHGDLELLSREEATALFDIEGIGKAPARMDMARLDFVNAHYLRALADSEVLALLLPFIRTDLDEASHALLLAAIPLIKPRVHTLVEMAAMAQLFLTRQTPDEKATAALAKGKPVLPLLIAALEPLADWQPELLKVTITEAAQANGKKLGEVMPPLRAALLGQMTGADIPDILAVLGKHESLERLKLVC